MEEKKIVLLIQKYLQGTLTPEEQAYLDEWKEQDQANHILLNELEDSAWLREQLENYDALALKDVDRESLAMAKQIMSNNRPERLRRWLPYVAAAILLVVASVSFWLAGERWWQHPIPRVTEEILPGSNRALLTLADGRQLTLDQHRQGIVMGEQGITYQDGATLDLKANGIVGDMASEVLTLSTPKGGTYALVLPDGSKVWLNAASSLTYPSKFDGQERVVKLEGEAYFDVKTMTIPFKVITDDREVNVLGTEFNISAYRADDDVRITLVEGKVSVSSNAHEEVILNPGQQAFGTPGNIDIRTVNTESYTAWKNGYFSFDETPLNEIMRQISRWYDAEVVYDDPSLETVRFSGSLSRYERLSHVLDRIAFIGTVRFEIRDRQIIVKSINH